MKTKKQSIEDRGGSSSMKREIAQAAWGRKGGAHGDRKKKADKRACRRFNSSDGW